MRQVTALLAAPSSAANPEAQIVRMIACTKAGGRSTDQPAIYRLRVRDAKLDPIVNLNSYRLYPKINLLSGLGSWGGLAPGDVPLLVRDISTSEIYALDVDFP